MDRATELELLSPDSQAVVRSEGQRYAGLVVQGDRLGEWVRLLDPPILRTTMTFAVKSKSPGESWIRVSETSEVGVPAGLPKV